MEPDCHHWIREGTAGDKKKKTFGYYNLQKDSKTETQLFIVVKITHFCASKERDFLYLYNKQNEFT